jgi:hypothetical protein
MQNLGQANDSDDRLHFLERVLSEWSLQRLDSSPFSEWGVTRHGTLAEGAFKVWPGRCFGERLVLPETFRLTERFVSALLYTMQFEGRLDVPSHFEWFCSV